MSLWFAFDPDPVDRVGYVAKPWFPDQRGVISLVRDPQPRDHREEDSKAHEQNEKAPFNKWSDGVDT